MDRPRRDIVSDTRPGTGPYLGARSSSATATEQSYPADWRTWLDVVMPLLFVVVALGLWALGLSSVDPRAMTDLGLVSVLPVEFYTALHILTVGFCVSLYRRVTPTPVLLMPKW